MSEIANSSAIRDAIAAGQAKATTVPLRESDGDDATVHALQQDATTVGIPTFEGFTDFNLDLTCLSPPSSPPGSIYEDARSITPPASPRHSISLSFRSTSPTLSRRSQVSQAKSASPLLPNPSSGTSTTPRGSWPLVRYVGRGTPIDKNRRIEWGGTSNESDDVGEDGVFSLRSPSLESTVHPAQRPVSPEWNILTRRSSTVPARSKSRSLRPDPPTPSPAILEIEGLGSEKPGEWASFMHTVLGESSSSAKPSTSQLPKPADAPAPLPPPAEEAKEDNNKVEPTMSPEEMQRLDADLGINLGIDGALDLGLGYHGHGGMNWFSLGMIPGSGRNSPSVYSSRGPSPRPSRPASLTVTPQDNRSTASLKVGGDTGQSIKAKSTKSSSPVWWRRVLQRIKKVPFSIIGSH